MLHQNLDRNEWLLNSNDGLFMILKLIHITKSIITIRIGIIDANYIEKYLSLLDNFVVHRGPCQSDILDQVIAAFG